MRRITLLCDDGKVFGYAWSEKQAQIVELEGRYFHNRGDYLTYQELSGEKVSRIDGTREPE